MAAPIPSATASPPTPRSAQLALAAFGVILVGLLLWRGYGPRVGARPTEHLPAAVVRQVDLNTADRGELLQVPGVGPGLADAILTHREERGRFETVEELTEVKGIKGKTLEKLRPWVKVNEAAEPQAVERLERKPTVPLPSPRSDKLRPGDPPLDLNAASEADLQRLPGIGKELARRIAEARTQRRFGSVEELRRVKGIGPKTLETVRPFVVVQ